ncbi:MAG: SgcJ/EcaC family oxidoreductase [Acidobacteriia bacterium]|nr:SgcJ/EcaC family oxidoreductase [Terriglobia bacterium]
MASTRRIATLAVALFLFFSLPPAQAQAPAKPADADSAAIQQVIADFSANFSRHDAHAMALAFAEDGDLTNMYGILLHGRKAIEERLSALFTGILRSAHRADTVRSIRFFTPQVALLDADTLISGTKAPDGSDLPDRKGLLIAVLTKQNGRWLLSNLHEAEFPAPRPAPLIPPPNTNSPLPKP